jgi:F420-dependent oxidoreductase-like protein
MKEYLASLMPLLRGETVHSEGEVVTTHAFQAIGIPGVQPPPVVVAALAPTMLKLAGTVADGTITWMTGSETVASHIVPTIRAAAEAAGRPQPRVMVSLPVTVTADRDAAAERINAANAIYPTLPSYKAMLDKEGAQSAADVALIGDEEHVAASVERLAANGATDLLAGTFGNAEEQRRTFTLLSELARS